MEIKPQKTKKPRNSQLLSYDQRLIQINGIREVEVLPYSKLFLGNKPFSYSEDVGTYNCKLSYVATSVSFVYTDTQIYA
jgi:hypothetical protein